MAHNAKFIKCIDCRVKLLGLKHVRIDAYIRRYAVDMGMDPDGAVEEARRVIADLRSRRYRAGPRRYRRPGHAGVASPSLQEAQGVASAVGTYVPGLASALVAP